MNRRWNEKDLLAETERIEALVKPYLTTTQSRLVQSADKFVELLAEKRKFIRQRRGEIMTEIAEGMPKWEVEPVQPFVISRMEQEIPFYLGCITGGCIGCVSTILVSWLINR